MKSLKILGLIVWNLIFILLVISVLSELEFSDTLVPTALCFMILSVIGIYHTLSMRQGATMMLHLQKQNALILETLSDSGDSKYLVEMLSNDATEAEKNLEKSQYSLSINALGVLIIFVICILTILGSL